MAYTLRTDEEAQFMREFEENLPAILDFRRRYPKESLEGAFYKVTGKEWMPGRSVKENDGRHEMTKDRTVGSVLGKYVAPIGAGALTAFTMGGAAPSLAGLFGGGGGVGASGMGAGLNAAAAGGGIASGGTLGAIGTGAGLGAAAIPTIGSTVYPTLAAAGPTLAGAKTATELLAESEIPTIPSRTFPVNATPQNADISGVTGTNALLSKLGYIWDEGSKSWVKKAADALTGNGGGGAPDWLEGVMRAMAGIAPAIAASQMKQGPSDEEKAYQAQATRLLKQQEQRTQFQNPLYEAVSRMAYNLQPIGGTQGQPYRYNTLDDVKVP